MSTRVLIIGGAGFLGSHLVSACVTENMLVRVADIALGTFIKDTPNVERMVGDYSNKEFLDSILNQVDVVIHMAHDSLALQSKRLFDAEYEANIAPTKKLMEACCENSVRKFIFVSSGGTVYGNTLKDKLISENSDTRPISLYGASKLISETIGFFYQAQKNLPLVVARPANAYGPGQQPFRGQGFISTALASALKGQCLNVYGDGGVIRDYIHARDIASALVALINYGKVGETYNIGSGVGTSLRDLIDQYIHPELVDIGIDLEINYQRARGEDLPYNALCIHKIKKHAKFVPQIDLRNGIRETLSWLQKVC